MLCHFVDVSLGDGGPQVLVITWHNHLHQVFIVYLVIVIRVEILYDIVGISFCSLFNSIITEKLQNFKASYLTILVAIQPLEG